MCFLFIRLEVFLLFLFRFLCSFFFPFFLFSQIFPLVSLLFRRSLPIFDLVINTVNVITISGFNKELANITDYIFSFSIARKTSYT